MFLIRRRSQAASLDPNAHEERVKGLLNAFPRADPQYLRMVADKMARERSEMFVGLWNGKEWYPERLDPHNVNEPTPDEAQKNALDRLAEVFPRHPIPVIREFVERFNQGAVYYAADAIVNEAMSAGLAILRCGERHVELHESIRSKEYKDACTHQLKRDFPNMRTSKLKQVLAANNYDYRRSFEVLELTETQVPTFASRLYSTIFRSSTASPAPAFARMIDEERAALIRERQVAADAEAAHLENAKECTRMNAFIECACCCEDVTPDKVAQCAEGHLFCLSCLATQIKQFLAEPHSTLPVTCLASTECGAAVAGMDRAVSAAMLAAYDAILVSREVERAGLPLVRCPFCDYAEEAPAPQHLSQRRRLSEYVGIGAAMTLVFGVPVVISVCTMLALFVLEFRRARAKADEGPREFHCRFPSCRRVSCLRCQEDAHAPDPCRDQRGTAAAPATPAMKQGSIDEMRLYIERAMAEATQHMCTHCRKPFVKNGGCNHVKCRCNQTYCYVCNENITEDGYAHFCQHVREVRGECDQCRKCFLYAEGTDEANAAVAAESALREYLAQYPHMALRLEQPDGPEILQSIAHCLSPGRFTRR